MANEGRLERFDQGESFDEGCEAFVGCSASAGVTLAGLVFESASGLRRQLSPGIERQLGVSGLAVEVLIRLFRSPHHELRMADLAAQTGLTPGGLTRAVDRLVEAGLVARRFCDSDRRVAYATLTAEGAKRTEGALRRHEEEIGAILAAVFDAAQAETLVELLRRLRDHVYPTAAQVTGGRVDHKMATP
jgi:MarR family transcriptional regulator, 2-MHQ and catechol-resistance regulon repressor